MNMPTIQPPSCSGYRFPAVIISHCTWLYFRFALSYRDVAEMMAEQTTLEKVSNALRRSLRRSGAVGGDRIWGQ
jgi:putative transposase